LRRNWAVQEVVEAFQNARSTALELAKEHLDKERVSLKRNKRKASGTGFEDDAPSKRTRSSQAQTRSQIPNTSHEGMNDDSEDGGDEDYKPEPGLEVEPDDGLVACPLCGRRMIEEAVFNHLDKCTGEEKPVESYKAKNAFHPRESTLQTPSKQAKTSVERLPHLNYTLLKDIALRKKLQELGIPTWGTRQLLIKRHTEWVDIYNSNSDCLRPRSVKDLLKDLDAWERSQGGLAPAQGSSVKKDFDHEDWKDRHKDHFNELIANARARRSVPTKETSAEKGSSLQDSKMAMEIPETTTQPSTHRLPTTTADDNTTLKEAPSNDPTLVMFSSAANEVRSPDTAPHVESQSQHSLTHTPSLGGSSEKLKKTPMFQVPEDPVVDIDGGTEVK